MARADDTHVTPGAAALRGSFIVDTYRGQIRIRKWPEKCSGPKSAAQQVANELFYWRARVAKYADPRQIAFATAITPGSGWMPRDVIMSLMAGRFFSRIYTEQGTWYSMSFTNEVSEAIDALSQTPGTLLWRGKDRWHGITPGPAGTVLGSTGETDPPSWVPMSGGGGAAWSTIYQTTITASMSTSEALPIPIPNTPEALRFIVRRPTGSEACNPTLQFGPDGNDYHERYEGIGSLVGTAQNRDLFASIGSSNDLEDRAFRVILELHRDNYMGWYSGTSRAMTPSNDYSIQPITLNYPGNTLPDAANLASPFGAGFQAGDEITVEAQS